MSLSVVGWLVVSTKRSVLRDCAAVDHVPMVVDEVAVIIVFHVESFL